MQSITYNRVRLEKTKLVAEQSEQGHCFSGRSDSNSKSKKVEEDENMRRRSKRKRVRDLVECDEDDFSDVVVHRCHRV